MEHKFLFVTLDFHGFGESLIRLVKVAFHGCMDYANIKGHLGDLIYISRGLHQGSQLLPILFLLVAQMFTRKIENNPEIEGFQINGVDILLSLFADDTYLFIHASIKCSEAVIVELNAFGEHSGCKCNVEKTIYIPLG